LVWYKKKVNPLSDAEIAFQSFNKLVKVYEIEWYGFTKEKGTMEDTCSTTIHPNQKPLSLYVKILKEYAKPGDKILDTHVGSASSIIACIDLGFDVWGYELDKDYYQAAQKRITNFENQLKLF
jgi:site-specific DNA-methyltransferase (adenine-specific)